jgi:hypothetical protein
VNANEPLKAITRKIEDRASQSDEHVLGQRVSFARQESGWKPAKLAP